jgi:Icc-related predicted phosphoesterase
VKLLLVSDLHYRLRQYDWVSSAARDPALGLDVVALAGDFLDIRSAVPVDAQLTAVTTALHRLAAVVPVLAASGNHDLDSRDGDGEKTARWLTASPAPGLHVDGASVLIGTTLFTVCPWWDGPLARDRLARLLETDAGRQKEWWVWVYHAPPTGSPLSWDGRREYGDDALVDWLRAYRPSVVLTGHIHQAPFVQGGGWAQRIGDTWLFNAGQQPGPVPTHVLLDLEARTAEWRSATDRHTVSLT